MKTTLYYFSGTGNSLAIAKNFAAKLGDCKLVPIANVWQREHIVAEAERVGFVFPLYYVGLPKIVLEFVNKIELKNVTYIFTVITRGVPFMGGAIHQLKKLLPVKSTMLHAGFYVNMPQNYIPWFDIASEKKRQRIFQNAERKVQEISEVVKKTEHRYDREPFFFMRPLRNTPFLKRVHNTDKYFHADDTCNSCGICQNICPVNNISLAEGNKPQWHHTCQQCLACLHLCPQEAIQYGTRTTNKTRYHHPDISSKDIMNQST